MSRTPIRDLLPTLRRPRAQAEAAHPDDPATARKPAPFRQRLKHVGIAGGVALLFGWLTLLEPVDQVTWLIQARLADKAPSGEIAFVGLPPESAASNTPEAHASLAQVLDRVRTANPELVVVDVVLEGSASAEADAALRASIEAFRDRIVLVKRAARSLDERLTYRGPDPAIAGRARQSPALRFVNYLGYTWTFDTHLFDQTGFSPTTAFLLSDQMVGYSEPFKIDYRYDTRQLPVVTPQELSTPRALAKLRGKKIVIGVDRGLLSSSANLPGRAYVPASFVMIVAAETLMGGVPATLPMWVTVLLLVIPLALASSIQRDRLRHLCYVFIAALCAIAVYAAVAANVSAYFGPVFFTLLIYGGLRVWWRARNRGVLFDDRTNLRTFRALERDLRPQETQTCTFIVARIHNFDEVLSVLPEPLHAQYIKLLSDRLRIADESRQMYSGGEGYFAWTMPVMGRERLTDHLLGTRLLCYEPVMVEDHAIDINVTFGVNSSADNSAARKLAAARNAAARSNEADQAIVFADHTADEEHLWNLSIQHKIDEAIETGQIYPVFQPQFSTETGRVVGVEALVRWKDPVRGVVPTDWFIDQCEKAGRIDRLTRLMLHESMRQVGRLATEPPLRLSVNISAISLQDMRLCDIVANALTATGFPPERLTLELTETWHIAKPDLAAAVMERIAAMGVRWALDDFGVKTATYDALMMYPIDEIKIDRSLTAKVLDLKRGRRIVRSICQMGAEMAVEVVAEGVETEGEFRTLRDFGCPVAQGFVLAPPMQLPELQTLLSEDETANDTAR